MANRGQFKKGEKRRGQGKRGPGKLTKTVKEAFEIAFRDAQADKNSAANLANFREHSPREFIVACAKLIPAEVKGTMEHQHSIPNLEVVAAALGIEKKP